jgi:predicted ABC-type ATPase/thiol-disulfide isomerase/thioredoxin
MTIRSFQQSSARLPLVLGGMLGVNYNNNKLVQYEFTQAGLSDIMSAMASFPNYVLDQYTALAEDANVSEALTTLSIQYLVHGTFTPQATEMSDRQAAVLHALETLRNVDFHTAEISDWLDRYFAQYWDHAEVFFNANMAYFGHSQSPLSPKNSCLLIKEEFAEETSPRVLELSSLADYDSLIANQRTFANENLVLLIIYSTFCSVCHKFLPEIEKASLNAPDNIIFCRANGDLCPDLKQKFAVEFYPTTLLISPSSGEVVRKFPSNVPKTSKALLKFLDTSNDLNAFAALVEEKSEEEPSMACTLKIPPRLQHKRIAVKTAEIFKALGCHDKTSCTAKSRDHGEGKLPPMLIFLGGGMGAGKSTVVQHITQDDFWQSYGENMVLVEADALKTKDPLFQFLSKNGVGNASEIVHKFSTDAAETLFLSALKWRRDIVFDGTMSWLPFAEQTCAMVRDTAHVYRRGPGYQGPDREERYWEIADSTEVMPFPGGSYPYRIKLVGVVARPEQAVKRGILRWLRTGRSVRIESQLRSHKLFSQNFMRYVELLDEVELYDNTDESASAPKLIAKKELEGKFQVLDEDAFHYFQQISEINTHATSVDELWMNE